MYEPLSNWDENVATWQNMLGPATTNMVGFTNNFSTFFSEEIAATEVVGGNDAMWTIPSNVVQRWLNDHANNRGVVIKPDYYGNKIFNNRMYWNAVKRPQLTINVVSDNPRPLTPTNMSPANAAFALPRSGVVLTASPFVDPNGNGHGASQWQVSLDPNIGTPLWDSGAAAASTQTTVATTLAYAKRYYWRVRYRDNHPDAADWSPWSAPTYFDTQLNLIDPVVLVSAQEAMIIPGKYPQNDFTFANSNFNGSVYSVFNLLNETTNVAPPGFLMYWFDARVYNNYTGLVVNANGTLAVSTGYGIDPFGTPTFGLHPLISPWLETNVTWNNYIGADWSLWGNKLGTVLDTVVVDQALQTFTWSVAPAVLQNWLVAATNNTGLALVPAPNVTGNVDMKTRRSTPPPTLTFDITLAGAPTPSMPTNVAPANGAQVGLVGVTLSATAYRDPSATPHAASQWQIALDSGMSDIIWDSGASTTALTSVQVPAGVLTNTTRYYWHVRYINQLAGKSAYSAPTCFDTPIVGGIITRRATRTAMIRYQEPASNWNGTTSMLFNPLNQSNGVPGGPIMLWFDLSIFQGQGGILASNPSVSVQLNWIEQIVPLTFYLHEILAPWNETGVTWDGFVGPDPATLTNLLLGPSLGEQVLPVEPGSTCTWTFADAVVQNWLDGVTTNFGLALLPQGGGNAAFYSRMNPARAPYLMVDIIPEPLAGGAALLLAVALLRRRA
jgi:hypothetical protein